MNPITSAWGDTVYFNDGGRPVNGEIQSMSDQQVKLRLPDGTLLPLNRSAIRHIDFGPQPHTNALPELDNSSTVPVLSPLRSFESPYINAPSVTFPSTENDSQYNNDTFIVLSTFRVASTHHLYAGLYKFDGKGTFWVRLPRTESSQRSMRFSLFGKMNKNKEPETYTLKARYLDQSGNALGESMLADFDNPNSESEWFEYLEGMSGLTGKVDVQWPIPAYTKTIEFQVTNSSLNGRHLVGYISDLMVSDR